MEKKTTAAKPVVKTTEKEAGRRRQQPVRQETKEGIQKGSCTALFL